MLNPHWFWKDLHQTSHPISVPVSHLPQGDLDELQSLLQVSGQRDGQLKLGLLDLGIFRRGRPKLPWEN